MIYDVLLPGERNAQSGRDLCRILNLTPRQLSKAVEEERRSGRPICATCDRLSPGYYLAESRQELQRYCNALLHRAGEIHKTRKACLKAMDSLPAEEEIEEKEA